MTKVVDFVCLRIRSEVDKFIKTDIIPDIFLEGFFTIGEIEECAENASPVQAAALKEILTVLHQIEAEKSDHTKQEMKAQYVYVMKNLHTVSSDFMFPTVLSRYRDNINPIRALYYDLKELFTSYSSDSERHVWLLSLLQDPVFYQSLCIAIEKDCSSLTEFFNKYYDILKNDLNDIPLELYHARQLIKDYKNFRIAFDTAYKWDPDE